MQTLRVINNLKFYLLLKLQSTKKNPTKMLDTPYSNVFEIVFMSLSL